MRTAFRSLGQHIGQRLENGFGFRIGEFARAEREVGGHLLLTAPVEVVNHDRHIGVRRYFVVRRRRPDAEVDALQRLSFSHPAKLLIEAGGIIVDDEVSARRPGRLALHRVDSLIDFLDQTGQGVARSAHEDQCDQVVFAVSDRTEALSGAGPRDEARPEAAAVVLGSDGRTGAKRNLRLQIAADQRDNHACG